METISNSYQLLDKSAPPVYIGNENREINEISLYKCIHCNEIPHISLKEGSLYLTCKNNHETQINTRNANKNF